jgi:Xaa-Pro aminopeptidase
MSVLGREKTEQAMNLLEPGELWLFLTQEGSDASVPLVFGSSSVGKAAFILHESGPKALVSKIDVGHLEQHAKHIEARTYVQSFDEALGAWLRELAPQTILLNYSETDIRCDGLTHGQYLGLERLIRSTLPDRALTSSEPRLQTVRSVKTAEELRRIQLAIDRTITMYERLLPTLRAGMTERQVQASMNDIAADLGAPPDPGDFGGPLVLINRVGMSHRGPTDEAIRPGDLLIMDTALGVEGYYSDIARTVYFLNDEDAPPERETRVFDAIYGAIDAAFDTLKPGVAGFEVDAAARNHLLGLGYPEIQHSTGHQIGRHVHDGGTLLGPRWDKSRRAAELTTQAGMVFTLEPTILMTPDPSMIVEENVLVTENGARYLNPRQETLWTAR